MDYGFFTIYPYISDALFSIHPLYRQKLNSLNHQPNILETLVFKEDDFTGLIGSKPNSTLIDELKEKLPDEEVIKDFKRGFQFHRRQYATAGESELEKHGFSQLQATIALITFLPFIPCLISSFTRREERSVRKPRSGYISDAATM